MSAPGNPGDPNENVCTQCNFRIIGKLPWLQHLESKDHLKRVELASHFELDEADMFYDQTSSVAKMTENAKGCLVGLEYLIEDRTHNELKCLLCRLLLGSCSVAEHFKSHRHHLIHLDKVDPEATKQLRLQLLPKTEMHDMVHRRSEAHLKRFGLQKPRVYEKGAGERRKVESPTTEPEDDSESGKIRSADRLMKETILKALLSSTMESFQADETAEACQEFALLVEPVLGLEYVAEYADAAGTYEAGYLCVLCEACMTASTITAHILSTDHKLKYLKRDHPTVHKMVTNSLFSSERRDQLLQKYSSEVEKKHGRNTISSKLLLDSQVASFVFSSHIKLPVPKQRKHGSMLEVPETSATDSHRNQTTFKPAPVQNKPTSVQAMSAGFTSPSAKPIPPAIENNKSHSISNQTALERCMHQPVFPSQNLGDDDEDMPPPPRISSFKQPPAKVVPKKPHFVYSSPFDKVAQASVPKVPPIADRNNGSPLVWYSQRSKSWAPYEEVYSEDNLDYISVRTQVVNSRPYEDWSPEAMRRLQDQFNFQLDHLAWLQEQFVRWRTPVYLPLEMLDLRPLEEEVEGAVLRALVGKVLRRSSGSLRRELVEYHATSATPNRKPKTKKQIFTYQQDGQVVVEEEEEQQVQGRSSSSESGNGSKKDDSAPEIDPQQKQTIIMLSTQIFEAVKQLGEQSSNPVLRTLLSHQNAQMILFNVALKRPDILNKFMAITANPHKQVELKTLNEMTTAFSEFSTL